MTLLNSNYEDWRKANPTASSDDFKFSCKKLNPAGALFDYAKLCDVSKNEIARLDAAEVYDLALEYAKEFDPDFAAALESDPEYARASSPPPRRQEAAQGPDDVEGRPPLHGLLL